MTSIMPVNLEQSQSPSSPVPAALQDVDLASNNDETGRQRKPAQEDEVASKSVFAKFFSRKGTKKQTKVKKTKPTPDKTPKAAKAPKKTKAIYSPQEYLDQALLKRGYSTKSYSTLRTAYYNEPTKLQRASYDVHILKVIVRDKDEEALRDLLSCGISPNACNKYSESLLDKVCKSGLSKLLAVFLECGADVRVSDGAGRMPLHNACWGSSKPSFETFEMILEQDLSMIFMKDYTGATPLSYIRKGQHSMWIKYLETVLDVYWPPLNGEKHELSALMFLPPNTRPMPDPEFALSTKLCKLVASGRMEPDQAMIANSPSGNRDWDDDSSVSSVMSAAGTGWEEAPWDPSNSGSALGSDYNEDESEEELLESDSLRELAGLEDLMGIMQQKQRQASLIAGTASPRTTV